MGEMPFWILKIVLKGKNIGHENPELLRVHLESPPRAKLGCWSCSEAGEGLCEEWKALD